MSFPNIEPPAQSATLLNRQQCEAIFEAFINARIPKAKPASVSLCSAFGSDPDEQDIADILAAMGRLKTTESEQLGEHGAIFFLQDTLASQSRPYDDDGMNIFEGANTFNLVYLHPAPPKTPQMAIVLEAKGGNSHLGSRWDITGKKRVKQGTPAYFDTIATIMANSSDPQKQEVGNALLNLAGQDPNRILYVGVQTKYDKASQEIYDPVAMFAIKM